MFQKKWSLLLFLLPGLILLVLFSVYPFFSGVRYSITDGTRAGLFVGLDNYMHAYGAIRKTYRR